MKAVTVLNWIEIGNWNDTNTTHLFGLTFAMHGDRFVRLSWRALVTAEARAKRSRSCDCYVCIDIAYANQSDLIGVCVGCSVRALDNAEPMEPCMHDGCHYWIPIGQVFDASP